MIRLYATGAAILAAMLIHPLPREAAARSEGAVQTKPKIKQEPAVRIASIEGKDTFATYCAACHGADAKGHGPAAPALAKPVPDLTLLASRNGGKFDALVTEATITGQRRMPVAHGTVDMPMWGPIFRGTESDPSRTSLRLTNLVKYLESIQQKPVS
jgi:mono/diheme cytochrome c family protein